MLRNIATKLVKRDKIKRVLKHLKKNPGPQSAWQEAKTVLGKGRGITLPDCTTNTNPNSTAEHQNNFFINKIADLVSSLSKPDLTNAQEVCGGALGGAPSSDTNKTLSDKNTNESTHEGSKKTFSFKFVTPGSVT